jgi:hypothetical protein
MFTRSAKTPRTKEGGCLRRFDILPVSGVPIKSLHSTYKQAHPTIAVYNILDSKLNVNYPTD